MGNRINLHHKMRGSLRDEWAQLALGNAFYYGLGVNKNREAAELLYIKASKSSNNKVAAQALKNLRIMEKHKYGNLSLGQALAALAALGLVISAFSDGRKNDNSAGTTSAEEASEENSKRLDEIWEEQQKASKCSTLEWVDPSGMHSAAAGCY